jgi:hypothetical protein
MKLLPIAKYVKTKIISQKYSCIMETIGASLVVYFKSSELFHSERLSDVFIFFQSQPAKRGGNI